MTNLISLPLIVAFVGFSLCFRILRANSNKTIPAMKRLILLLSLLWITLTGISAEVPLPSITEAANAFMQMRLQGSSLEKTDTLFNGQKETVGYLFRYSPSGFLIVSSSADVNPVYAYSVEGNVKLSADEEKVMKGIMSADLDYRVKASAYNTSYNAAGNSKDWSDFLAGVSHIGLGQNRLFEQWPPQGSTPTGGWIVTNYTQSAPYNIMCPLDLNAGSRSVAGCPAIAMAQIINYHREINHTRFDSTDDYYHNFGSGNSYWIDDDHLEHDFPSFDTLNLWLDTLEETFAVNGTLSNSEKAALSFACGVAAHQVYSKSVSGTFGMEQAAMAFQRFGFDESRLVYPKDTTLNTLIADNVKKALPVHLGLLSSTGSGGHNVVVDGYNTDEFYHFNFGWGGSANGWYTLPPQQIPYSLTVIESALLDIKSSLYTFVPRTANTDLKVLVYPNPMNDFLVVEGIYGKTTFTILNPRGEVVFTSLLTGSNPKINNVKLHPGCYIYRITDEMGNVSSGKLISK